MGLVHTKTHSKLSTDKVRKTTIVGMDIKRLHIEAGLIRPQSQRNFTTPGKEESSAESHLEIEESDRVLDFDELSNKLVGGADAGNQIPDTDSDTDDDLPPAPPISTHTSTSLRITLPHTVLPSTQTTSTCVKRVSIPLKKLFVFPTELDVASSSAIEYFWQGGIRNLEQEMEAHEILMSSESGNEANPDVDMDSGSGMNETM